MQILITSAASSTAQGLATALKHEHQLRLTDQVQVELEGEFVHCPLEHDFSTNLLVRGMEAIIHMAEPFAGATEEQQLDYLTRGTYNLLWAATAEKVRRVVYLSTLELMDQYDETFIINERWRPRPTAEPRLLAKYLGEAVCREFAREHKLEVVVLRLGHLLQVEEETGEPPNPMWVDHRDITQAVGQALEAELGRWSVFHIHSNSAGARFPISNATKALGYTPTVSFE